MTSYAERAKKAATAQAFHRERDTARRMSESRSRRDISDHIEVGNEQTTNEKRMREEDIKAIEHIAKFYKRVK